MRLYQLVLAPWSAGACRFTPSCSHYAREAFLRHGAGAGGVLTVKRLLRCHPWGSEGYDPVPEPRDPSAHSSH